MSNNPSKEQSSWQDTAKKYAKVVVVILIAIWIFNIAQGAQNLAQKNKKHVQKPNFEIATVPGGPQRFETSFQGYLDRSEKDIKPNKYLWSTLIIENTGGALAEEITISDVAAAPMVKIGYEDPGYGFTDIKVKHKSGEQKATINVESLELEENLKIFIAFNPEEIAKPYDQSSKQQWAQIYDTYQVKVNVKSEEAQETLHLDGLPQLNS